MAENGLTPNGDFGGADLFDGGTDTVFHAQPTPAWWSTWPATRRSADRLLAFQPGNDVWLAANTAANGWDCIAVFTNASVDAFDV